MGGSTLISKIARYPLALSALLLFCLFSFGDYWNTTAVIVNNFGVDVEIRMSRDVYYKHIHFDWNYKLHRYLTLTLSLRDSYIKKSLWEVEHKPMLNLTCGTGLLKNRSRFTLRIKEGRDIWRFRNKITFTPGFCFIAFEAFFEKGRFFKNRYYLGANFSKNISAFLMRQITGDERIWIIGSKLIARF